ncbi:MAG: AI-2E family transporter YdiK [Nitrospiraceae bacterium]|nr:AI-2E family transporter YdiK [Nitrospiraceae bacterium]
MNNKKFHTPDVTGITLAVIFIGMLITASFWILSPFLVAIIWAIMIVVATWPMLLGMQARLRDKRGLAVAAMTVVLLLIIVVPFSLVVVTIVDRADKIAELAKSLATLTLPPPPEWLGGIPVVGLKLADRWQQFAALGPEELSARLAPYARQAVGWFIAQAGSLGMMIVQFLLTVIIAAILYANGETASAGIRSFARRLAGQRGEDVVLLAGRAIRGVALGVVVTAIMQATLGGIGLAVTGVPAAALLTGVMFMLCLAQIGPILVLIPAVIWLFWKDGALWGSVLLVFSVLAVTLDNFVRPVLIRKSADLPLIMIFAGVVGGLIAFGVIGLFVGPVVLAVAFTLLEAWISNDERQEEVASTDGE